MQIDLNDSLDIPDPLEKKLAPKFATREWTESLIADKLKGAKLSRPSTKREKEESRKSKTNSLANSAKESPPVSAKKENSTTA